MKDRQVEWEIYKIQWMQNHGYTLNDMIREMRDNNFTARKVWEMWYEEREEELENLKYDLAERIPMLHNADLEDFLGYQISANVLEGLADRIFIVLDGMNEDELLKWDAKLSNMKL